jgi:protein TonB
MKAHGMAPRKPAALVLVGAAHAVLGWALLALGSDPLPASARAWPQDGWRLVAVRLVPQTPPKPPKPPPALAPAVARAPEAAQPPRTATQRAWQEAVPAPVAAAPSPSLAAPQEDAAAADTVAPAMPSAAPSSTAAVPMPPAAAAAVQPHPVQQAAAPGPPARDEAPPVIVARADRQQCPPAPHPAALRERGIEGTVLLRVKVDVQGRAADVQLLAGSGWRLFDEAALQQVRGCRFIPAMQGGQAVDSWVEFPVRFALAG